MAIVYPSVPYAPIINAPIDALIYQSGSKVDRTEYGMDTRTRKYKGFLPYYQALAEAFIGTYDPDYNGLKCVAWSAEEGDISAIVIFQYKGAINSGLTNQKPPFPINDVSLQSASVQDDGWNSGTSTPTSVWFQYFAPQTTWKWAAYNNPTAPTYTAVINNNFDVVPFNMNPPTPIAHLQYDTDLQITHFHSEPAGDWWDIESTSMIQIIPKDLVPIG